MPFALAAVIWFGWKYYDQHRDRRAVETEMQNALLTAQLWVAAIKYRHEPEVYEAYRDSALTANHVSQEQLLKYLKRYETSDDDPTNFTRRVNVCVDSLLTLERGGEQPRPDPSVYE